MQEKLMILRKSKNVSQKQLADLIKISTNQYSLKEKGIYAFNGDEMFAIADFFDMTTDEIFLPRKHQSGVK